MRILVIEDEMDLRSVIVQGFIEDGYAVDQAANGLTGLEKALTWPYDLIVLDIMLPTMDGWTVLDKIRSSQDRSKVPVLILTARDDIDDRLKGLDGGADDYLVKPFSIRELLARARAIIRRTFGKPSSVEIVGDVHIDLVKKTVAVSEKAVPLTAREFALVELLLLSRGRVVSRTEIYDHIFDENDDSCSNLLDVHVSNIRKKLGAAFITTRRGQGYMVE